MCTGSGQLPAFSLHCIDAWRQLTPEAMHLGSSQQTQHLYQMFQQHELQVDIHAQGEGETSVSSRRSLEGEPTDEEPKEDVLHSLPDKHHRMPLPGTHISRT